MTFGEVLLRELDLYLVAYNSLHRFLSGEHLTTETAHTALAGIFGSVKVPFWNTFQCLTLQTCCLLAGFALRFLSLGPLCGSLSGLCLLLCAYGILSALLDISHLLPQVVFLLGLCESCGDCLLRCKYLGRGLAFRFLLLGFLIRLSLLLGHGVGNLFGGGCITLGKFHKGIPTMLRVLGLFKDRLTFGIAGNTLQGCRLCGRGRCFLYVLYRSGGIGNTFSG